MPPTGLRPATLPAVGRHLLRDGDESDGVGLAVRGTVSDQPQCLFLSLCPSSVAAPAMLETYASVTYVTVARRLHADA
jgi:hypothetical protein